MSNFHQYHFSDFTTSHYRELLRLAKAKYFFRTFTEPLTGDPTVIWRHDIDFSIHRARRLAHIEAEEDVTATYFLLLHSEFYNLLEQEVVQCVRDIIGVGHAIGLHFDAHIYGIEDEGRLDSYLRREKRILEELFERQIEAFSFHITTPFTMSCQAETYGGMINVYAERFRREFGYCSDSNGYWRHRRLYEVLLRGEDERLQVLTHPEFWQEEVMSPKERIARCADGRAEKAKQWYDQVVRAYGRENVDW